MKYKEHLQEKLYADFLNKDITIIIEGTITTNFIIKKAKIVISESILFITDSFKKDLILSLDDIVKITTTNCITIDFEFQRIILDY